MNLQVATASPPSPESEKWSAGPTHPLAARWSTHESSTSGNLLPLWCGCGVRTSGSAWSGPEHHRRYHPAMAWRAKCYECGQDAPITRPLYGKQSLLEDGDLGLANLRGPSAHADWPPSVSLRSEVVSDHHQRCAWTGPAESNSGLL